MDQVIFFNKSLQQRLIEYETVFSEREILPGSAVRKDWAYYLELSMDPNGWQAVWKIQRKTCETLSIPFPSIVLILVLNIEWDDLVAVVKVLAVQDDIHIPDKHWVPLIHLWPTKDQDKSIPLNIQSTANMIDMLRFFYNYIFMPWDYDEDDTVDWRSQHLESRLRLYYDMKNGIIPRITAERVYSLMTEAKRLYTKQQDLESKVADIEENETEDNSEALQSLMDIHLRMSEIKWEMDVLENQLLRNAMIKRHTELSLEEGRSTRNIWAIYKESTANECIKFFSFIEKEFPNEILRHSANLSTTLESGNANDIYFLKQGTYCMKTTGNLEDGGTLKGVSKERDAIITTKNEDTMLCFKGEQVLLENLTIQATLPQIGMIVSAGKVTLKNCKFLGDGKSSTHQGIIVLTGSQLEIIDCEIGNFATAIVGNSGSIITMNNCEIYDCSYGLKIFDNCTIKAMKVTIRNCKDYGICVETENSLGDQPKIGDFDTLNIIPKIQMEFIKGDNNAKGDAIINQKSKLKPISDLFANSELDPTACVNSEEEMDVQQNTSIIDEDLELPSFTAA